MTDCMEERCVQFAQYIIDTRATVRATKSDRSHVVL